ncbi:putative transcription factor OFP family [Helianthus debilis subsp. tardiflorus]
MFMHYIHTNSILKFVTTFLLYIANLVSTNTRDVFMGKQKFRLSHMIPNAWFYRLRDMNTAMTATTTASAPHNKNPLSTSNNHPRNSLCYTPKLYSSPSNRTTTINRPPVPKHVLGSIYIRATESAYTNQDLFLSPSSSCFDSPLFDSIPLLDRPFSTTCGCGVISSSIADLELEFNEISYTKSVQDSNGHELIQKPPQIRTKSKMDTSTKPKENDQESAVSIKTIEENIHDNNNMKTKKKKLISGSNSSKVCKKVVGDDEKKFSSSCCIVKSTFDPCKDLKESMMEMIVDYNIRESQDLEKLLAFYLSLNSNEYHGIIVKAFEEIWLTSKFLV